MKLWERRILLIDWNHILQTTFSVAELGGGVLVTFKQNEGLNVLLKAIYETPEIHANKLSMVLEGPVKTVERQIESLTDKGREKVSALRIIVKRLRMFLGRYVK